MDAESILQDGIHDFLSIYDGNFDTEEDVQEE